MVDYSARIASVRVAMEERGISVLFLPVSSTLEYLTGLSREIPNPTEDDRPGDWVSGMYLGLNAGPVIVEPRMGSAHMERQVAGKDWISELYVLGEPEDYSGVLTRLVGEMRGDSNGAIALGQRAWTNTAIDMLKAAPDAELVNAHEFLGPMRMVKDDGEREAMRRAVAVVDNAYEDILAQLRLGMTSREITWIIDRILYGHGADGVSFHTSVYIGGAASGDGNVFENTSNRVLGRDCTVAFDFGALLDGYCSDFGRTVFTGEPSEERRRVYDLVISAQAAAIEAMKDGQITAAQLDRVARSIIEDSGHGPAFIHRLGHAIGKDVHEPPFLLEGDDTLLQTGMFFTIEPSVVMDDGAFIRVEDVVMVTPEGGENLNRTGHELRVLEL
ncbi:MAG: aminopeptidase P family protein [Chloroflexia bacterium]|nr:aminopeptidase P family protein [Chloroflexia bacterium]